MGSTAFATMAFSPTDIANKKLELCRVLLAVEPQPDIALDVEAPPQTKTPQRCPRCDAEMVMLAVWHHRDTTRFAYWRFASWNET